MEEVALQLIQAAAGANAPAVLAPQVADALPRSDALDSALFAQLEAGKMADPFVDPQRWDRVRLATLGKLQWVATSTKATECAMESRFTLAELLAPEAQETAASPLTEVLAPLLLPETWLEGLWARTEKKSVQVSANVVEVRRNGELAWTSLSFNASSSLDWCGPYRATEDKPVTVRVVHSTHALSDGPEGYAHIREKVINALGAHATVRTRR